MALTDSVLHRFQGPSVWGESDCVEWLHAITGIQESSTDWRQYPTEAAALRHAIRRHGSYLRAIAHELRQYGYLKVTGFDYRFGDVVFVEDRLYGPLPAGIASGPTLIIRHPQGLAMASGETISHLRRMS